MRNVNFPFERRPSSTGMAQGGLASFQKGAEEVRDYPDTEGMSYFEVLAEYGPEYIAKHFTEEIPARAENIWDTVSGGVDDAVNWYERNRETPIAELVEANREYDWQQLLNKVKEDYPEVLPRQRGMAQGGLASIPRYAEGAEEEIEEKEESTLDQIISYLLEHSGILPEGLSLQGLLGGEEMAHGGVVPGTNPIQGEKGGPTLGYQAPDPQRIQRNQRLFDLVLGDHYADPRHLNRSRGYNVLGAPGTPGFSNAVFAERFRLDKAARAAPAPEQSTYTPTGAQTFDDLAVAPKVEDPIGSYVVGSPSREQLLAQYFPANSSAVQQQQATGLPQLTEEQLLGLAGLV